MDNITRENAASLNYILSNQHNLEMMKFLSQNIDVELLEWIGVTEPTIDIEKYTSEKWEADIGCTLYAICMFNVLKEWDKIKDIPELKAPDHPIWQHTPPTKRYLTAWQQRFAFLKLVEMVLKCVIKEMKDAKKANQNPMPIPEMGIERRGSTGNAKPVSHDNPITQPPIMGPDPETFPISNNPDVPGLRFLLEIPWVHHCKNKVMRELGIDEVYTITTPIPPGYLPEIGDSVVGPRGQRFRGITWNQGTVPIPRTYNFPGGAAVRSMFPPPCPCPLPPGDPTSPVPDNEPPAPPRAIPATISVGNTFPLNPDGTPSPNQGNGGHSVGGWLECKVGPDGKPFYVFSGIDAAVHASEGTIESPPGSPPTPMDPSMILTLDRFGVITKADPKNAGYPAGSEGTLVGSLVTRLVC